MSEPLIIAKAHKVGDVVVLNPESGWARHNLGIRLVVTKVPTRSNEKNFTATPCDDEGQVTPGARGFKGPPITFLPEADASSPTVTEIPLVRNVPIGSVVRPGPNSQAPAGLYVVIGETDSERVRIMKIGGDNGRYFRAYSKYLIVLDPAEVTAALAGL